MVRCLHSAQTTERGDRWRKICKAYKMAFCPWRCNVRFPGKRSEEPGLWFLWEWRAEFSYSGLCSIVSITHWLSTGQDLQREVLAPVTASSLAPCSTAGAMGFRRAKPPLCEALITQQEQGCSWHRARIHRLMVPMGVLEEPWDPMLFVLKETVVPTVLRKVPT